MQPPIATLYTAAGEASPPSKRARAASPPLPDTAAATAAAAAAATITTPATPASTTDAEAEADARLWAGAWAAGWRVKGCASKGHYMYTAPDGRSFGSKRAALEAAGHAAASPARAAGGAEAAAPARAGVGVGSRVVDSAGARGEVIARNGAWLTMRTEAGEERSVRKMELKLLSAGEAGEAGGGAVQAAPAGAAEAESLKGRA